MSAEQGSILAEGQYGTFTGEVVDEPPEDYVATVNAIALRLWRGLLLWFLQQVLVQREQS